MEKSKNLKFLSIFSLIFILFLSIFTFTGCIFDKKVYPKELSITQEKVELFLGQTKQLEYTFSPSGVNTMNLVWSSSNPKLVTVSNKGRISSVNKTANYGACVIYLKDKVSGLSSKCSVIVNDGKVYGIGIDSENSKTKYVVGQSFSKDDFKLLAKYESGVSKVIDNDLYEVSAPEVFTENTTIQFTYLNFTIDVDIEVVEDYVDSIKITKNPNKTTYIVGEKFDPTGMEVTLVYFSGKTEVTSNYTYDETALSYGVPAVEIKYQNLSTFVFIEVVKNT